MNTLQMPQIPRLSIGMAVEKLLEAYTAVIEKRMPVQTLPSVMLWGPPGVGKSQGVRQLAEGLEERTGKRVVVHDVRLLLFNPIDLRGIPTSNADKTLAIWLKPKIFQMPEGEDVYNILFLDEISAASPSVQAAAYQITLDRAVGEHRLPANCIVIAAGNRVGDKSVAYKMPTALANRLLHLEIEADFKTWRSWAARQGIHEMILGFLSFRQEALMQFDKEDSELAFATPRTWEMVDHILRFVSDDLEKMFPLVAGLIGSGTAAELYAWTKIYQELPEMSDIFDGKNPPKPNQTDKMYALVSAMTEYARQCLDQKERMENSIRYASSFPADFAALLFSNYMVLRPNYQNEMLKMPAFQEWIQRKGLIFNGLL